MSRKTITLESDSGDEVLLRQYAGFLEEMKHLAATAPAGETEENAAKVRQRRAKREEAKARS